MNKRDKIALLVIAGPAVAAFPFVMYATATDKFYTDPFWFYMFVGYFTYLALMSVTTTILGISTEKRVISETDMTPQRLFAEAITMAAQYTGQATMFPEAIDDNDIQQRISVAASTLEEIADQYGAKPQVTSSYFRLNYAKYSVTFDHPGDST